MHNLTDPIQIKARVMAMKLTKIVKLQSIFDEMRNYSQIEGELRSRSAELQNRRESRQTKEVLKEWLRLLNV